MSRPATISRPYFDAAFFAESRDAAVDFARRVHARTAFDTVVVTGVSGCVMGALIAHETGAALLVIRKDDDESTHSYRRVEGMLGSRWVFVDDFIDTGATRKRVKRKVAETAKAFDVSTTFVGTIGYQNGEFFNGMNRPVYSV